MTRYFIYSLLFFCLSFTVNAQEFYAGPLAGATFSQVDGDSYAGYNKFGFVAGGFVGREISDVWKLQFEIAYVQKGSLATPDVENGDYSDYRTELNYIQFPLTLQLTTGKFQFEGGVSYGSLLYYYEEAYDAEIPEKDQVPFNNVEWSGILGFSYKFTDRMLLNCRLNYSLVPIREPYNGEIPVYDAHWDLKKPGQYNNVFSLALYYNLFSQNR